MQRNAGREPELKLSRRNARDAGQVLILTVSLTRVFIGGRLSRDSLKRLVGSIRRARGKRPE